MFGSEPEYMQESIKSEERFQLQVLMFPLLLPSVTALLFKMEEANLASRAKAQEFIQATSQVSSASGPLSSS